MVKLYQVKDRLSGVMASGIQLHVTDKAATRSFVDMVSDERSPLAKHAEDYDLYCLGDQEDDGQLQPLVPPVLVMMGGAVVEMLERKAMAAAAANRELPGQLPLPVQ